MAQSSPELSEQSGEPIRDEQSRYRPPWWRRRYVVNREFQLRFAWSAVLVGLVSSAVSSFMILLSFWSFNIWQGQRLPIPVMLTILFVMITNVAGIYVVAVLTTQRIAGPIFNLARQFDEISAFRFGARARFRKRDELQYIADRFNLMANSLEKRDQNLMEELRRVQDELSALSKEGSVEQTEGIVRIQNRIESILNKGFLSPPPEERS